MILWVDNVVSDQLDGYSVVFCLGSLVWPQSNLTTQLGLDGPRWPYLHILQLVLATRWAPVFMRSFLLEKASSSCLDGGSSVPREHEQKALRSFKVLLSCLSPLLLHSICRGKSQSQSRFKEWGNRLYFLVKGTAMNSWPCYIFYN